MVSVASRAKIKVADEIWIATALLHLERGEGTDFTISQIVDRAIREDIAGEYRPGLPIHASAHCVASKRPNPARHRFLTETGHGRRRLYREGDLVHPARKSGRTHPEHEAIPREYRHLIDWYERQYSKRKEPAGQVLELLNRFIGSIDSSDLREMESAIGEDSERIDHEQW